MPIISLAKPQCSVSNLIYLPSVVLKYFDSDLSRRYKCQAIFCSLHSFRFLCFSLSLSLSLARNMCVSILEYGRCCCLHYVCCELTLSKRFVYNLANININPNGIQWFGWLSCDFKCKEYSMSIMVKCVCAPLNDLDYWFKLNSSSSPWLVMVIHEK